MTRDDLSYRVVPKIPKPRSERVIINLATSIPLACLYFAALFGAVAIARLFH